MPKSTRLWLLLKIAEFRKPTPKHVRKIGSKILKLPSVRNCFTLAMINKLVVIINSLEVPKVKKILLYEMKFLVPNYSCLQKPWIGGYRPQIPVLPVLCPQMNLFSPVPKKESCVRHCRLQWIKKRIFLPDAVFGRDRTTALMGTFVVRCRLGFVRRNDRVARQMKEKANSCELYLTSSNDHTEAQDMSVLVLSLLMSVYEETLQVC